MHCGFNIKPAGPKANVEWICPHGAKNHRQQWSKGDEWAFNSDAWKNAGFVYVRLETIHRQRDPKFLDILNRCRVGEPMTMADISLLARKGDPKDPAYQSVVTIMCINRDVDEINRREFNKLDAAVHH